MSKSFSISKNPKSALSKSVKFVFDKPNIMLMNIKLKENYHVFLVGAVLGSLTYNRASSIPETVIVFVVLAALWSVIKYFVRKFF